MQLEQKKPGNKFEWLYSWFVKIFKVYPVTVVSYMMIAIFGSLAEAMFSDIEHLDRSLCFKVSVFFVLFSFGSLLTEEIFRRKFSFLKKSLYLICMIIFAIVSLIFVFTIPNIRSGLGMFGFNYYHKTALFNLINWSRFALCYIVICLCQTKYLIYKRCRAEEKGEILYENYYASVFFRSTKAYVIYVLTMIIFMTMIGTTVYAVFREFNPKLISIIQILSLGFIIRPIWLRIFSTFKKDLSRVLSFIVKYISLPILMLYFFVNYICAIGTVFNHNFSPAVILTMLGILFISGLPIWTIGANFKNQVWGKISVVLPFVFSPLIIFQIVCLSMQIRSNGINPIRYLYIMLIIFEISYLLIYSIKSRRYLQYILFVFAALFLISQITPFINIYSVTIFPKLSSIRSRENSIPDNSENIFRYEP